MDSPLLHAVGLRRTYVMGRERIHALAGVDLVVERRAFYSVLGPSGSGKSTLLHLLGGLDRPTAGVIAYEGARLDTLDEDALAAYRRAQVGFIFQAYNLIPSMTAVENVSFPLVFQGVTRRERYERARALLAQVGVADRARHRPSELSGGQQQRVAVARALANNPRLILADEPTGNLDSQTGLQIMQLLADLHSEGRTVMVVSHDPRMTHFATHTLRLLDGRLVSEHDFEAALAGGPSLPDEVTPA